MMTRRAVWSFLIGVAGCANESSSQERAADRQEVEESDASTESRGCVSQVTSTLPLKSARYDPDKGGLVDSLQTEYVVAATRAVVKPERDEDFMSLGLNVVAQVASQSGMIAYATGEGSCGDRFTLSIWENEEAMYAFVTSGAHASAMAQSAELVHEGSTTHWTASEAEVNALSWDDAQQHLEPPHGR